MSRGDTRGDLNLASGLTTTQERATFGGSAGGVALAVPGETALRTDFNTVSSITQEVSPQRAAATAKRDAPRRSVPEPGPAYFIEGLEKWEGRIEAIYKHEFSARLLRVMGGDAEEYEAEFGIRLVSTADADVMRVGANFYLTVRTVKARGGRSYRTASIVLRRPGRWSATDVEEIRAEADQLVGEIADAF